MVYHHFIVGTFPFSFLWFMQTTEIFINWHYCLLLFFNIYSFTVQLASCFAWDGFSVIPASNSTYVQCSLVPFYVWLQLLPNIVAMNAATKILCCSFQLIIEVILFTGYTICVVENDAPAKPTYLRLTVVDRKVHITTFTHATFSSGSSDPSKVVVVSTALTLVSVSDQLSIEHSTCNMYYKWWVLLL